MEKITAYEDISGNIHKTEKEAMISDQMVIIKNNTAEDNMDFGYFVSVERLVEWSLVHLVEINRIDYLMNHYFKEDGQ